MAIVAELGKKYPCQTQGIAVELDKTEPMAGDIIEFYLESPYVDITTTMAARAIFDIQKVKEDYPQSVIHYVKVERRTVTIQYSVAPMGAQATPWVWWQIIAVFAAIVAVIFAVTRLIRGYLWAPPPPVGDAVVVAKDHETQLGIADVDIFVDGEPRGKTDSTGVLTVRDLLQGDHKFTGETKEGYHTPDIVTATIVKDQITDVEIVYYSEDKPKPTEGWLVVGTHPIDGIVYINEQDYGKAPIKVRLERGDYEVSFEPIPDYKTPLPQTATIQGDEYTYKTGFYIKEEAWWEKYLKYGLIGAGIIAGSAIALPRIIKALPERREKE
jgi:hypothetical protein